MSDRAPKSELRNTWESAAPGWAKWERVFSAGLTAATETLLDMAGAEIGMRVLDVACGAGAQTVQAAKRVGPTGEVLATDISATMLQHVRDRTAAAGLTNVSTLERAADELDGGLPPFDAAISRLGLMLFSSPRAAVDAIRDVLKPGARFAALVFASPAHNPFFSQSMAILLRHAGRLPPASGAPGLFALAGDGVLEDLLAEGGLVNVTAKTVRAPLVVPSVPETLDMMREGFGAYRAVVADLDEAARHAAWAEVEEFLRRFEASDGGFATEFEFIVGAGAKPI